LIAHPPASGFGWRAAALSRRLPVSATSSPGLAAETYGVVTVTTLDLLVDSVPPLSTVVTA
jgi:hypothetical protein